MAGPETNNLGSKISKPSTTEKGNTTESSGTRAPGTTETPGAPGAPEKKAEDKESLDPGKETTQGMQKEVVEEMLKKPKSEKLPDNKFGRVYKELKEELKKPGAAQGPLAAAAVVFYYLAKYYGVVGSLMPDGVSKNLDEGDLKKEKLTNDQVKNLLDHAASHSGKWNPEVDEKIADPNLYKGKTLEQASAVYASSMLGLEVLDRGAVLGARLAHTTRDGKNYYKKYANSDMASLLAKPRLPRGTVVLFKQGLLGGLISAYATGNGHELAFFNAKRGEVEEFDSKSGKCSLGNVTLHIGLFPNFSTDDKWAKDNPEKIDYSLEGPLKALASKLNNDKKKYKMQKPEFEKGSSDLTSVENAVNYVLSSGVLKTQPIKQFKASKVELLKLSNSDKKTAALQQLKTIAQDYKVYIKDQKQIIEQLIKKERGAIEKYEERQVEDESAKAAVSAKEKDDLTMTNVDQMSLDPQVKENANKAIEFYQKLCGIDETNNKKPGYFDKILAEVEKYLG